jgi:4-hydroxy-2-oxoheptanedioate aldolase
MSLKSKERLFGTWCEIPSPVSVHALSQAGLDFVLIDLEHGAINLETAQNMVFAAHAGGCATIVRVSEHNIGDILPVLDTGADGLMIPHVESVQDVDALVSQTKFYPIGNRGFNPFTSGCGYQSVDLAYLEDYNKRLVLSVILENEAGIENVDAIAEHEQVDIVYLGQYDLSIAMGIPGQLDDARLLEKMTHALAAIRRHGKVAGCMVHSGEQAKAALAAGYRCILYKVDVNALFLAYKNFLDEVKA